MEDIRLLGRILGDVIREQEGKEAFELIERVRQLSVAYRLKQDASGRQGARPPAEEPVGDQTVSVIRAFSYFSHLANIAEDRHHVRRRSTTSARATCRRARWRWSFERLHDADIRAGRHRRKTAGAGLHRPVLTAHPTEVQRKSILDAERAMAELIGERDRLATEREPRRQRGAAARPRHAAVADAHAALHQADGGRRDRERAELLPGTFLRQIPSCTEIGARPGRPRGASFLRMGHWIGGDRDGNPNVGADTLELALRARAEVALRHYLTEVHALGAELSISQTLAPVSPAMQRNGRAQPDHNPTASDEPYRRALIGMYARLAATLHALTGTEALRHAVAPQNPYHDADEFLADLRT
jgi:phosphoenolpyruvate carboxylase